MFLVIWKVEISGRVYTMETLKETCAYQRLTSEGFNCVWLDSIDNEILKDPCTRLNPGNLFVGSH